MSAGRMAAERQRRGHHDDIWAAASAGDSRDRAEAGPTVTVHVPLEFRQRRGRKVLVAPDGAGQGVLGSPRWLARNRHKVTPAMRALARAFRWRKLLETGSVATVQEIAAAEKINPSYVSRVLRITLLAPEVIEAVVSDVEDDGLQLERLMRPFPVAWQRQLFPSYPVAL